MEITLQRIAPAFDLESLFELWAAPMPETPGQGRVRCAVGDNPITIDIRVRVDSEVLGFFSQPSGGNLVMQGMCEFLHRLYPGDTVIYFVHWEGL